AGDALRKGTRSIHDRSGERALWDRRRVGPARARARGAPRPRRAAARRRRARVVRPRHPPATAARIAGRAAEGSRARRAGLAGTLPAELAWDRPPGDAARSPGTSPGPRSACVALG